jgi:hypothetical protein
MRFETDYDTRSCRTLRTPVKSPVAIRWYTGPGLLFLGSLPEEYEPDQVLRAAREKEGPFEAGVAGRSLPGQGSLSAGIPSDRSGGAPTHRAEVTGPLASRPLAPAILRGRELAAKLIWIDNRQAEHCGEFHFTTPFRVRLFFSQQRASAFLPQALFWFKERCSARCQVQRKIPGQARLDFQGISHAAKDSSRLIRDLTHLVFFHCNQRSASNS